MGTASYQVKIRAGAPGDIVDLYVTATGVRIATGTIPAGGDLDLVYPQSYGPAHAVIRDPTAPQPWQANHAYTAGDLVSSPHFGGWLLKCAISGTSGTVEPTDDNRLKGQVHRPVFSGKAMSGAGMVGGGVTGTYAYSSLHSNTAHDGGPGLWFDGTQVDCVTCNFSVFMLRNDGTVKFSATASNGTTNAAYAQAQSLTNIVKLYGYKNGILARDSDDNLHHINEYDSSSGVHVDNLLAANPTAVAAFPAAEHGNEVTLLLADKTAVSNSGLINGYLNNNGIENIDHGVQNGAGRILCLRDNGQRLHGFEDGGVIDYSGTWVTNDYDAVDELQASFSMLAVQYRSGRRQRFLTSGTYIDDQESMVSYMVGPPPDLYPATVPWAQSPDHEGTLVFTPYSGTAMEKPNGFSNGLRGYIDPTQDRRYDLGGHPIIRDAGCTWHLIKPQGNRMAGLVIPASIESDNAAVPVGSVSGTLAVDQTPAERPVLALAYVNGAPEVLASGVSDENGDFSLTMPGHVEPVYLLAMDNAGPTWSAGASVTGGQRVIPTAAGHTGLVYECSNDGTTAATEPTWPTEIGSSVLDGSVTWEAIAYYQPQAHGPVHPLVTGTPDDILENGNTYAYLEQQTIEGVVLQVFANTLDGADLIYRRLALPADIVDGDTWAYTRTHHAGLFYADEYANTLDSADLIYRLLDGSLISTALPLALPVPNGSFEDNSAWVIEQGEMKFQTTSHMGAHSGTRYISGGPHYISQFSQDIDFADDCGLAPFALQGALLAIRWQQASYSGNDMAQVTGTFLDDQGNDISSFQSALYAGPIKAWESQSISAWVPAGAVGINIKIYMQRGAGTNNDGYTDTMDMYLSA